jgi:hypothetical protein
MRGLTRFAIRLYPLSWRARYGEEFQALVEDSAPSLSAVFDLMKGAIKMHLTIPSFPKLALLLSVAGVLAGWGGSFLIAPTYVSQATLQLAKKPGSTPADLRLDFNAMQQEILSRGSLKFIIENWPLDLYPEERRRAPLEDVIETMRTKDLRIALAGAGPTSAAFTISFSYNDPVKAHDTVQALIRAFQQQNIAHQGEPAYIKRPRTYDQVDRMEARIAVLEKRLGIPPTPPEPLDQLVSSSEGTNLDVIDPPTLPMKAAKPNRAIFAFWGFGAGFIAALIVVIFRRPIRPAIPFPARPA